MIGMHVRRRLPIVNMGTRHAGIVGHRFVVVIVLCRR